MMDNMKEPQYPVYQKKILGYLDGSLNPDEKSEFEAFVRTHPEFESQVKTKEDELMLIKSLIPAAQTSPDILDSLEAEMKLSVFNLLKPEPKTVFDRMKNKWEDWVNR
jgi:anti-sigma-K factor RskA